VGALKALNVSGNSFCMSLVDFKTQVQANVVNVEKSSNIPAISLSDHSQLARQTGHGAQTKQAQQASFGAVFCHLG
jgi:hypothetical protein